MMSGDFGLRITVPAARQALSEFPQLFLHLAGDQDSLSEALASWPEDARARVSILHAPDSLPMGVQPSSVLRNHDASSMRIALETLAAGTVVAVVSAGNAGALMILARKLTGAIEQSTRPAFCSLFPTQTGSSLLLDLGANVDCSAQQLCSFAILASALYASLFPGGSPTIALLSNGVETAKGSAQVRRAAKLLEQTPGLDYVGYVEANKLHAGVADIVVCDGFVGNVTLKAIEGTAELASEKLAALLAAGGHYGASAEQLDKLLIDFSTAMDPEIHNGAFLLGIDGIVIKAHGHSSVAGFVASISQALKCEKHNMIAKIKEQLSNMTDRT